MRALLLIAVLNGLVPSFRDGIEAAGEAARGAISGEQTAPASEGAAKERDCGVLFHVCGCCSAQPAQASTVVSEAAEIGTRAALPAHNEETPGQVVLDPLFRPPIG